MRGVMGLAIVGILGAGLLVPPETSAQTTKPSSNAAPSAGAEIGPTSATTRAACVIRR